MKQKWFKKWGWLHYPVSLQGWVILVVGALFLVHIFVAIDRNAHSVSDTLYGIFPYYAIIFLLYEWLASKTSGR